MATVEPVLIDEAGRLAALADERGLRIRLFGGVGIRMLLGESMPDPLRRTSDDLDYLTDKKSLREAETFFEEAGWEGDREFNGLNGNRRQIYHDPAHGHKIDVFVGSFEMCHELPLAERMDVTPRTLPAAELALTKLQVVTLNEKDKGDLYALFACLPVTDHDESAINADRIVELTSRDWGLHHTLELNLERLEDGLADCPLDDETRSRIRAGIGAVRSRMEAAPKSRGWRLRARIGERKRWYELPEEVDR